MVEFVIVLPIMLFLVFMIAFAGIGFERYLRVSNAARVAAREAALARFYGPPCDPGAARDAVIGALGDEMAASTVITDCVPGEPGTLVTVTLEYPLPDIPLISGITGPIVVSASATERRE
jgi:Flp pilus assembly protein TadG